MVQPVTKVNMLISRLCKKSLTTPLYFYLLVLKEISHITVLPNPWMLISIPAGQFAFEYEAVAIVLLPQLGFLHEGGGHVLPGRPHDCGFDGSKPGRSSPKTWTKVLRCSNAPCETMCFFQKNTYLMSGRWSQSAGGGIRIWSWFAWKKEKVKSKVFLQNLFLLTGRHLKP